MNKTRVRSRCAAPQAFSFAKKSSVVQGEGLRVGVGLVLGKKDKVVWHLSQEHFSDLHPISAVGRCQQCLQLISTPEQRRPLVYLLRRKHEKAMGHIAVHEAQPLQQEPSCCLYSLVV